MALYAPFGGSSYITLPNDGDLDLPNSGWAMMAIVYLDSVPGGSVGCVIIGRNAVAPFFQWGIAGSVHSFATSGRMFLDIRTNTAQVVQVFHATAFPTAGWVAAMVSSSDNVTYRIAFTGGAAISDNTGIISDNVQPTADAIIGRSTAVSVTTVFNGRIAVVAKWNRAFTTAEMDKTCAAGLLLYPTYLAHPNLLWCVQPVNSSYVFDEKKNLTVTPSGSVQYGNHAPIMYPSAPFAPGNVIVPSLVTNTSNQFVF